MWLMQFGTNISIDYALVLFTHIYILLKIFFSIVVYPRRLDIVPCAIE